MWVDTAGGEALRLPAPAFLGRGWRRALRLPAPADLGHGWAQGAEAPAPAFPNVRKLDLLQDHRRLDASVPRLLDASTPRRLDASAPRRLDASIDPRHLGASTPRRLDTSTFDSTRLDASTLTPRRLDAATVRRDDASTFGASTPNGAAAREEPEGKRSRRCEEPERGTEKPPARSRRENGAAAFLCYA